MSIWNTMTPPSPSPGDLIRLWTPREDVVPGHVLEVHEDDPLIVDIVPLGSFIAIHGVRCAHALGGPQEDQQTWSWPASKFDTRAAAMIEPPPRPKSRAEQVADCIKTDYRPRCVECGTPFMHEEAMVRCSSNERDADPQAHGRCLERWLHTRCAVRVAQQSIERTSLRFNTSSIQIGTFEWALLMLRAGLRLTRPSWRVADRGCHHLSLCPQYGLVLGANIVWKMNDVVEWPQLNSGALLATDWELA